MEDIVLDGSDSPTSLDDAGYELFAPGLIGVVSDKSIGMADEESMYESMDEDEFVIQLAEADVNIDRVFEIEIEEDVFESSELESLVPDEATPQTRFGEQAIVLQVPAPAIDEDMAILYTDEDGTHRWILPEEASSANKTLAFHLPRERTPLSEEDSEFESMGRRRFRFGRKIIRVLRWTAIKVIGSVTNVVAKLFEWDKYNLFAPSLNQHSAPGKIEWGHIAEGPALLLCHGTASSVANSFGDLLPSTEFQQLSTSYNHRVVAFDHPTLSKNPEDNVDWLLKNLPKEQPLNLNVLSTSRGGLVARELLHRTPALNNNGWNITINKLVMSACPNRGTVLANPDSIPDYLDRLINLQSAAVIINRLLDVVKLLMRGIVSGLPGIQAQQPSSDFIGKINALPPIPNTHYYALAADFNPTQHGLKKILKRWWDRATDRIFDEENDGIVPTKGIHTTGAQSAGFPIKEYYAKTGNTHHLSYFSNKDMREHARDWLMQPAV